MRNYLTLIIVKKAVTFASALFAVGFVYFHGAPSGTLTYYYNVVPVGRHWFWGTTIYGVENLRGIAVGPTDFQRRLQFVIASVIDPDGRIPMKRKGRGAGW